MAKKNNDEANQGRRGVLKTLVMGAGGLTTLPILGQAETARAMMDAGAMPAAAPPRDDANWKPRFFDEHQNETLIALTDLIIPATDTGGAKAALVNRFFDLYYNDETPERQKEVLEAVSWFDGHSLSLHNKPFIGLTQEQQISILEPLADPKNADADTTGHKAFELIKGFTIWGYYSSQIGLDMELKYEGDRYNTSFPGACTHPEHQS
ncbi:MAG TPA: gluconate 2-dehydrogenase subunit 3 family protein [Terriglobia bacterium]|nr:gluconate 2-dehydrogenase subunit 3 family protein [Terriglobia bacterium]